MPIVADKLFMIDTEVIHISWIHHIRTLEHSLMQISFTSEEVEEAKVIALRSGRAWHRDLKKWLDWYEGEPETPEVPFKYDEERLLKEFNDYVAATYGQHYVGKNNVQSLDLIFATGKGEGFCTGNVLKYGARAGKKAGQHRADLLKVMHYAMLALYLLDQDN